MTPVPRTVAVLDAGKTNIKLALVATEDGGELSLRTTPTVVRTDGPYLHFDVERVWAFAEDALAEANRMHPVEAISITAHGSAGAFLSGAADGDGLAVPIIDYEDTGPDELSAEYDAVRPPFAQTLSPRLPAGLNLGAQMFWQTRRFPAAAAAAAFVNYPQYWAWRLSGVAVTEIASTGAHSDLWRPAERTWSSLPARMGWDRLLAPMRSAFDRLGPVRPALARRLGLGPDVPVVCGIHDSNASLLPHLSRLDPPFTVVSTGTWVIIFCVGARLDGLDPRRDTLANVNAYGDPVPCARFMGGREFDTLTGGSTAAPSEAEVDRVLTFAIMALPSFTRGIGPFPERAGGWSAGGRDIDPASLPPGERAAAASLYVALVSAESIRVAGGSGPVVVEGPFGRNALFCAALGAATGAPVRPSGERTGTTAGAVILATGRAAARPPLADVSPLRHPALDGYVALWRNRAASPH